MSDIAHQPCPHPDCTSSDAFSYNVDKGVGKCHSCGVGYPAKGVSYDPEWLERYPLPKGESEGTYARRAVPHVSSTHDPNLTKDTAGRRGITETTMKAYGVYQLVNDEGKAVLEIYTYPDGTCKGRVLPKEGFYTTKGFKSDELFGMDKFNAGSAKAVTITEGELDALSAFQMTGSKYPVVSLPTATPSKGLLVKCRDWLNSFDRIVLSLDSDGKSDHFATKLASLFPNRVYVIDHDVFKDANEFLQAGRAKEYLAAWFNARKFVPENTFNSTSDFMGIYEEGDDSAYVPTGIQAFDDLALGLMQGHFTVFQAPEGIGKTELMRYLEYSMWQQQVPIAVCHLEETKRRSLLGLVSYHLGLNLTRKDLVDELGADADVRQAITDLTKDERLWQFSIGVDDDPTDILDKIRFFATACDVKYVFFEPIQDLGYSRHGDETLESFLSNLSTKLSRLASELNVGIITIAHENDDGNIRDCRMIGKRASVVVKLHRDKMDPDEEKKNLTTLMLVKNRPASQTGQAGLLRFDPDTFVLTEAQESF